MAGGRQNSATGLRCCLSVFSILWLLETVYLHIPENLANCQETLHRKKNVWLLRGLKLAQDNLTLDFSRLATFQLLHIIQVQPISLVIAAFIGTSPLHAHQQPH